MHRAATSLVPQQRRGPHAWCRAAPRIGLGAFLVRSRPPYALRGLTCSAARPGLGISSSNSRHLSSLHSSNGSSSSSWSGSLPRQLQQLGSSSSSRPRASIIAAGRPRKSEQQPVDPNSAEALAKLSVAELRARCEQEGLSSSGKKADLVAILSAHLQDSRSSSGLQEAGDDDVAAAGDADLADGEDADISFDELLVELQAELQTYSKPELVKCLQDRGLSSSGAKKELVARLAEAVAEESGMARDAPAQQQQQQQDSFTPASTEPAADADEQQQQQQPAAAPAGSSAAAERDWLVADKQQQLYDEMLGMGVKRQELLNLLAELGQSAAEDETAEELAERASWLLAEEEVLLMEQQQAAASGAGAAGAEGMAASPSSILDSLTATDINKMKVDDLKAYLRQLGLSDEGGRYVLRDRLMTMLVVRRAATAGDMDHLLQQLSQMTLSELRVQLEAKGLDLSGSKAALEMRLAQALVIEIVGPEAAGLMGAVGGQPPAGAEEDGISNPLLDDYDELLTAAVDPAATIALVFSVSGSEGGSPVGASRGHVALVSQLLDVVDAEPSLPGLLVEPLYPKLARWEVAVLSSAEDGPVALLPAELEQYSPLAELADADLALQEWQMMQAGMEEAQISQALEALAAAEPTTLDALTTPDLPDPLPHHTLKLHMPPRASNKIVQTIRHTAAKAVAQLGLEGAGLVRVSGWMALQPDWQQRYELPPEALQKVADYDAGQLARMAADEAAARASEPNPLCGYYDEETHMADLAAFEPAARMHSEGNGEGDVMVADVGLDVPLAATSIAGLQALEVGLTPGGVARHLINLALLRHSSSSSSSSDEVLLLPPPTKPETAASAQWAQATGANDTLGDITKQLADAAVEAREAADGAALKADVEEDRAAFASMPFVEGVSEVLAALSKDWLTEEEIAAPIEEPEEWTPEFDSRTQEEIAAERDAGRPEEDLAARAMRDEDMFHYGNQPIRYDRWDTGDSWVPPAIEAAGEGKLFPDVRELQAREDAKRQAKRDALLDRQYSEEDRLPEATEDEVLMGRILGHDRYKGGVTATLQRRERQGGDPSLSSAAAAAAAAGGPGSDAAAAAAAAAGGDEFERWPWPSEAEVVAEAALRRPAPRVWVLVGGDGPQRQRAFRSGANVAAKLARCCDIQVDVFLMPPACSGAGEAKRRATLLSRRTEWRALGIPEELHPQSMTDEELINMPPADVSVLSRQLIVAGPQHLARHTIEEAAEAAERCAARTGQSYIAARVLDKQQRDSHFEAQMELDGHFVQGVGSAWGAEAWVLPPAPRFLDMEELLAEAKACDATLLLLLDDSTTADGQLQQILEGAGLPFTGMTSDFAFKCSNRLTLSKAIGEIADSLAGPAAEFDAAEGQEEAAAAAAAAPVGLVAVPKKVVKSQELLEYLDKPEEFEAMFGALLLEWECSSVAIKPPTRSGGLGVVRLSGPEDLYIFADALRSCTPRLPAGTLEQQPLPVTLPLQLPELLVVEPWIETDAVSVAEGGEVQWAGVQRWVEVTVGLIGELGSMTALQPTLVAYSPEGSRQQFTPPPQHILPAAAVEAVQAFAVALADGLGLRSIAAVDGFVNVDSGELVVLDVQQLPDLANGSAILQQVLANDPPMLPYQLFRHLAQQAYISQQAAQEAAAAGGSIGGSAYYSAPDDEGGSGFGAEDFDLGQAGVQGLAGDLFAGGADDAVIDDGAVDDEEMQGMSAGWTRG
ncbi:hypothetical protein OEZ85_007934 [Tetradesmus obliquus]|uniref:SAP domain-containing protein n=1 Tax=Tetradesmus obliquus TaxID=3088 RepID=A0ABY8THE9_TETOB|nr:hypothetical protein OEZ85_007934 [Tetradesmus obliquus]